MEEFDAPDPEFVKGFNEGYTLAQQLPELSQQLQQVNDPGSRGSGFRAGQQQAALDQERQRTPLWSRPDFSPNTSTPDTLSPARDDQDLEVDLDR